MAMQVKWDDMLSALEFVSMGRPYEHVAVLCMKTGEFLWHSEVGDNFDEWPDDVDDEEKYISIPHKLDLDLGKGLAFAFTREFLPADFDDVQRLFSRRGAYAKFKDLLHRRNTIDRWYEFEARATEKALRGWCDFNDIEIVDDTKSPTDAGERGSH